jgi:hypothetical protein
VEHDLPGHLLKIDIHWFNPFQSASVPQSLEPHASSAPQESG